MKKKKAHLAVSKSLNTIIVTVLCPMAELIMQIFRTEAGCPINTTSHIEGYHGSLKVLKLTKLCIFVFVFSG